MASFAVWLCATWAASVAPLVDCLAKLPLPKPNLPLHVPKQPYLPFREGAVVELPGADGHGPQPSTRRNPTFSDPKLPKIDPEFWAMRLAQRPPFTFKNGWEDWAGHDQPSNIFALQAQEPKQVKLRKGLLGQLRGRVVEIGCGTGAVTRSIASENPDVEMVFGIEQSSKLLKKAWSFEPVLVEKVTYAQAPPTKLPLEDSFSDSVIFWTSLSRIPHTDLDASLREAFRVLKPGGLLHVFDIHGAEWKMAQPQKRISGNYDPLDAALERVLDEIAPDRDFMWKVPWLLRKSGFMVVGNPMTYTIADTERDSYGFGQLVSGLEAMREDGMDDGLIDSMELEAERRVEDGEFKLLKNYAYVTAMKPIADAQSITRAWMERHPREEFDELKRLDAEEAGSTQGGGGPTDRDRERDGAKEQFDERSRQFSDEFDEADSLEMEKDADRQTEVQRDRDYASKSGKEGDAHHSQRGVPLWRSHRSGVVPPVGQRVGSRDTLTLSHRRHGMEQRRSASSSAAHHQPGGEDTMGSELSSDVEALKKADDRTVSPWASEVPPFPRGGQRGPLPKQSSGIQSSEQRRSASSSAVQQEPSGGDEQNERKLWKPVKDWFETTFRTSAKAIKEADDGRDIDRSTFPWGSEFPFRIGPSEQYRAESGSWVHDQSSRGDEAKERELWKPGEADEFIARDADQEVDLQRATAVSAPIEVPASPRAGQRGPLPPQAFGITPPRGGERLLEERNSAKQMFV